MTTNAHLPCTVWDADGGSCIGIFGSRRIAGQFIFGPTKGPYVLCNRVTTIIKKQSVVRKSSTQIDCRVIITDATEDDKRYLADKKYIIRNPLYTSFTSSITKFRQ